MKTNFKGVIDTTFREGQQSSLLFDARKYKFSLEDKKAIFQNLLKLGVRMFEFFSPVVSEEEISHFEILKSLALKLGYKEVKFLAHCRIKKEDIFSALKAGFNGLNLYLNLSPYSGAIYSNSLRKLIDEVIKIIINLKKQHPDLYIRFSAEDFFRSDLNKVLNLYDAIHRYVDTLGIPDTVGIVIPQEVEKKIQYLRKRYPEVNLEVHFHNTRGFSLINALTAVKSGANYVDTTILGIGERSGITSLTGLLLNLYLEDKNYVKNYDLKLCYLLNVLLGSILNMPVPSTEPVSLINRTHVAGVHQKAVLNNKQSYEGIPLHRFGVNKSTFLLGPLSGTNLIYYFLKEIKGYHITKEQAKIITKEFKSTFSRYQQINNPEDILMIIADSKGYQKK